MGFARRTCLARVVGPVAGEGLGAVSGAAQRLTVVLSGLLLLAEPVALDVVEVEAAADGVGVGEAVGGAAKVDAFREGAGVLVGVDGDLVGEVDDGLDRDVGVAEPLGDLAGQDSPDVLDAGDTVVLADGVLVEVDVADGAGSGRRRPVAVAGAAGQQVEELGGAGEPPERLAAQDVLRRTVGEAGCEQVGNAVDGRVDPDGVAGTDARDDVTQPELVGLGQCDVAALLLGVEGGGVAGGVGSDDLGADGVEEASRSSIAKSKSIR